LNTDEISNNCSFTFVTTVDAYWPLDGDTDDASGNSNDENGNVTITYSTDAIQGSHAVDFSSTVPIQYSNGSFMNNAYSQISFSAWIKPSDLTGNQIIYEEGGLTNGAVLWLNGTTLTFSTRAGGISTQVNVTHPDSLVSDQWQHVVAIFDNGELRVYLDGVASPTVDTGYVEIPGHGNDGGIGGVVGGENSADVSGNFTGLMDAVRYSNSESWSIEDVRKEITSCDTDGDGTTNSLDLDSDNDGCSDANEYYESTDADGGDDGVYGLGTPATDSDGLVTASGYDGTGLANVTDDTLISGCSFIQENTGSWSTPSNWNFNLVPTVNNDAIINDNITSTVTQNQAVKNLELKPGSEVSINNTFTLSIKEDLDKAGNFTGEGEVMLDGTSLQTITGEGSFENLRLNNGNGAIVNDSTSVYSVLYVDTGDLVANANLYLRCRFSTPPKTAQIAPVGGSISGDVFAEQCYPARRAFRLVASSVTTSTSIRQNWQENPADYQDNPRPGYGIHITGLSPGQANANVADDGDNGFDFNPSGNASMFTLNASGAWDPVPNTTDNLVAGAPYSLMIRGSRGIDITRNDTPPIDTKLAATGTPETGDVTFTETDKGYMLIGNPYQAQVNMKTLLEAPETENLSTTEFYVWDPTLGGAPTVGEQGGRGAYVTVDITDESTSVDYQTGDDPNASTTDASIYLQPMQAVFVNTTGTGDPSVTFKESYKAVSEVQTTTKREIPIDYVNIQLYHKESLEENLSPSDGLSIKFSDSYSSSADDDSPKYFNRDESLSRPVEGQYISIERRPIPEMTEELPLSIFSYIRDNYVMKFNISEGFPVKVYLKDKYTAELTAITAKQNEFSFHVDSAIPATKASNRFSIVFEPVSLSLSDADASSIQLYPNPTQGSFTISGQLSGSSQVEIFNVMGQKVYQRKFEDTSRLQINDFKASSGIYVVKLTTDDAEKSFKLLKE
jgi:hypothetical protein